MHVWMYVCMNVCMYACVSVPVFIVESFGSYCPWRLELADLFSLIWSCDNLKIFLGILIAWHEARVPGFSKSSIREGQVVLWCDSRRDLKISLALEHPRLAPLQPRGCFRAKDHFENLRPSSQRTTCSVSYRSTGNPGIQPVALGARPLGSQCLSYNFVAAHQSICHTGCWRLLSVIDCNVVAVVKAFRLLRCGRKDLILLYHWESCHWGVLVAVLSFRMDISLALMWCDVIVIGCPTFKLEGRGSSDLETWDDRVINVCQHDGSSSVSSLAVVSSCTPVPLLVIILRPWAFSNGVSCSCRSAHRHLVREMGSVPKTLPPLQIHLEFSCFGRSYSVICCNGYISMGVGICVWDCLCETACGCARIGSTLEAQELQSVSKNPSKLGNFIFALFQNIASMFQPSSYGSTMVVLIASAKDSCSHADRERQRLT